jgi:hypothetical protein
MNPLVFKTSVLSRSVASRAWSALQFASVILAVFVGPRATAQDTLSVVKSLAAITPANTPGLPWTSGDGAPSSVVPVGDVDGDGFFDLAASFPDNGNGTVHILFMGANSAVDSISTFGDGGSGFPYGLVQKARFGACLASIGDINADGVNDLAVLASGQEVGPDHAGVVYIVHLSTQGTALSAKLHSSKDMGWFFSAMAGAGDIDGNGITDIMVSDTTDSLGMGRVRIMLLDAPDVLLATWDLDSATYWPGEAAIYPNALFGRAMCGLGDLDGNGIGDIAVAAQATAGYGGAVNIILLDSTGSVVLNERHLGLERADPSPVLPMQRVGYSLCALGDLNGDGTPDLAASTPSSGTTGQGISFQGEVQLFYLLSNGSIQHTEVLSDSCSLRVDPIGVGMEHLFGTALAGAEDLDGDLADDILLVQACDPNAPNCTASIRIIHSDPKPFIATITEYAETPTRLGSADIVVRGGVRPYTYWWSNALPPKEAFDSLRMQVDAFDWTAAGLPSMSVGHLNHSTLDAMALKDPSALPSGTYSIKVTDARKKSKTVKFDIGYDLKGDMVDGILLDGDSLEKAGGDGWENSEYTSLNILGYEEDGWLKFTAPKQGSTMAVGVRQVGMPKLNGYEQMEQAFLFMNNTIQLWFKSTAYDTGIPFDGTEECRLKRQGKMMYFLLNDSVLHEQEVDHSLYLFVDVAIYKDGGVLKDLVTTYLARGEANTMKLKFKVEQLQCGGSSEGLLVVGAPNYNFTAPPIYTWTFPDGSTQTGTGLGVMTVTMPGLYSVTVVGTINGVQYTGSLSVMMGYEALWYEHIDTSVGGEPNTLKHVSSSITNAHAASVNELAQVSPVQQEWYARTIGYDQQPCSWSFNLPMAVDRVDIQRLSDGTIPVSVINWDLGQVSVIYPVQNGQGLGAACLAQEGDRVVTYIMGSDLIIDDLDDQDPPMIYAGLLALDVEYRLVGRVPCPSTEITKVLTSFSCKDPQRALLHDDLSGGYHRTANRQLNIGYWEDYNDADGGLDYRIHAMDGTVVVDASLAPQNVSHGYNELRIPLAVNDEELPEGFYWLEVTNEKGIRKYLRFHYDNGQQ